MTKPRGDTEKTPRVCLGVVSGAHGIRGEVKIKTFGEDPLALGAYGPLRDEADSLSLKITKVRAAKGGVVAVIEGIADRNRAEELKGIRLYVSRAALPGLEDEEYYHADLVGLAVDLSDGQRLGEVIAVDDFGAGPVLEIRPAEPPDAETIFAPFTREVVPQVDLSAGRLILDPPPGLLDGPKPPRRRRRRK